MPPATRCPWAPNPGALVSVKSAVIRDLNGRGLNVDHPLVAKDWQRRVLAIVAGRYEGSADWAMIFIITPHGLYQYNATSVDPQRDAVQID